MQVKIDPRHAARELALSSIFGWVFIEQEHNSTLELSKELLELNEEEKTVFIGITNGVKTHLDQIDKIIKQSAPDWPLEKISKVDLVILRMAVYEVVFSKNTPTKVAIDEAVELAKEFGNDTSHKFVNGVLGTVAEHYINQQPKL